MVPTMPCTRIVVPGTSYWGVLSALVNEVSLPINDNTTTTITKNFRKKQPMHIICRRWRWYLDDGDDDAEEQDWMDNIKNNIDASLWDPLTHDDCNGKERHKLQCWMLASGCLACGRFVKSIWIASFAKPVILYWTICWALAWWLGHQHNQQQCSDNALCVHMQAATALALMGNAMVQQSKGGMAWM